MSRPIIAVENLSKSYLLGHKPTGNAPYVALRDVLSQAVGSLAKGIENAWKRGASSNASRVEEFWALKDVSFDLNQGDVVGVVGRNGAGKSTLLKILSRITEPTEGRVTLRGRVASLLEVGTGFHPELTGRENIFLNGAILGMPRKEIIRKFDEIVDFAEVERFLDTPVKRYSSGMYVRLAFSVAAHLDPEILIVDEVLAVGDASFQKKCLGKMQSVSTGGRTVIFVSHQMAAVRRLCTKTIFLASGSVRAIGPTADVIELYLSGGAHNQASRKWADAVRPGNETARLRSVSVVDSDGQGQRVCDIRNPIGIQVDFEVRRSGAHLVPSIGVFNSEGILLFVAQDVSQYDSRNASLDPGDYRSTVWIPGNFLGEGLHVVNASMVTPDPMKLHFDVAEVVAFEVVDSLEGGSARGNFTGPFPGAVRPLLKWEIDRLDCE